MRRIITDLFTWVPVVILTAVMNSSTAVTGDPCYNYTALDQPWRATRAVGSFSCDNYFTGNGWYRLLYYGMNIQMPEICIKNYWCGTSYPFWLNGSHPEIAEGIVTRQACGSYLTCCEQNVSIQVKACPGKYYVYEFVNPNVCNGAYCADLKTISPVITPMKMNSTNAPESATGDPCYNYTTLDQPWRATNQTRLGVCDNYFSWNGWYRLLYNGMNIRMPEICMTYYSCGSNISFWLNGSHPQISEGIITRQACGSSMIGCCENSVSIRVKACPGNYYVYEFAKPGFCYAAYCADVNSITPVNNSMKVNSTKVPATGDPCFSYTTLDQPWRATNGSQMSICDDNFNWNGWYRLLYYGMNIRMPESCTNYYRCGTFATFWLNGSHPQISDGIISRQACGSWINNCCTWSVSIRVKACSGNYYVYEFVKPNVCTAAYCADVNSITPVTDPVKVNSTTAPATSDPCYNYTALDQPWRATTADGSYVADKYFSWNGWYRLMYYGMNIRMPEICTTYNKCGTSVTFWLNGSHPQISDGIITRQACGCWTLGCCEYSASIRVKACSENYYIYEFVKPDIKPNLGFAAYCADVNSITPITVPMKVDSTTAPDVPPNITMSAGCQVNFASQCAEDLFNQIENINTQVLPLENVTTYLGMVLNTQEQLLKLEAGNPEKLILYGNAVLNTTEKLVSTLVTPTETSYNLSISLKGLDLQVFAVGSKASMNKIPQLSVNSTQMEIDLIQISKNNNGSAAVAFMSYSNMNNMLKPSFFNTTENDTVKTMMSTVVSATLPKTNDTRLTKPVNFTMKHIKKTDPNGTLSCVYWKKTEWVVDGCYLVQTNSTHTVCSCVHLSTFGLIMQIKPAETSDPLLELLNTVLVAVGLVFLSLTLLTFVVCRRHLRMNNTPRINLCISLLLAHLIFLLTQNYIHYIQLIQILCAVLAGVLHFFFLSAFVWMLIEAVLLFISVKNLTKIRSKQKEALSWKWLIIIGYLIPLVVVGVSVGLFPDGHGSEQCWIKMDRGFHWSFLGPVCVILAVNVIIFVGILFTMKSALAGLNSGHSQINHTKILVFKMMVQSAILGCPWILGLFINGSRVLEMVFIFLNSQQGTFIFLVYCVLNQEVRQQYRRWASSCCVRKK